MKIFRYYYAATNEYPESGFLIRLDDIMRVSSSYVYDEILKLVAIFEDKLPGIEDYTIYFRNPSATSWFTEKGNRKFKKAINVVKKYLHEKYQYEMICLCEDIPDNDQRILYQDEYQIILKRENEK